MKEATGVEIIAAGVGDKVGIAGCTARSFSASVLGQNRIGNFCPC